MTRTALTIAVLASTLSPTLPLRAEEVVVVVDGVVRDSTTGKPVHGASVSAKVGLSPVTTDSDGRFKFIFLTDAPVQIEIHKEGYEKFERYVQPQPQVHLEVRLELEANLPRIEFSSFRSGLALEGRVEGLPPRDVDKYKILVYVLTDKWYIHPYAENREGSGYARIQPDGSWSIRTVFRGYQAYRVAFLLVKAPTLPPPSVRVDGSAADGSLLSAVSTVASLFIEAPEGI